jgi:hypothetical protein
MLFQGSKQGRVELESDPRRFNDALSQSRNTAYSTARPQPAARVDGVEPQA